MTLCACSWLLAARVKGVIRDNLENYQVRNVWVKALIRLKIENFESN